MVKKSSAITVCIVVCVFTFVIATVLTAAGGYLYLKGNNMLLQQGSQAPTSRLDEIKSIYHNLALNDVPDDKLMDGAAKGMAWGSGDIYSAFFTADEFKEFRKEEAGTYVGIGVSVNVDPKDKLITAVTIYKDSPAEKAGMLAGDKIIKVNDTDVTALTQEQTVKLVRGDAGTQVRITVLRDSDTKELTMTRAEVKMNFTIYNMLPNNIGYIRIYEFSGDIKQDNNAAALFNKAVTELKAQGMKGFILDLRNNPGGSLDIVAPIADALFPAGPIITMVDRTGKEVPGSKIISNPGMIGLPMVVLVNENSASASELLSGGIQDYKVGTLIGVTTFGKGVAQSFASLSDGSVLKYTADKYLTGGGRCPQTVGIKPDIEVEASDELKKNPNLFCTDKDNQFQRAVEELTRMIK